MATSPSYVMYHLEVDVLTKLGLPDMVFPVRSDRVDEAFSGDELRFDLVVDELDRYEAGRPDTVETFGPIIARLAHLVGTIEGIAGRSEVASRYFARGLSYAPDSFGLNADLALAFHVQGLLTHAVTQYRRALALEPYNPLVLILAARANQAMGFNEVAMEMLNACPADYRNDTAFQDLCRSLGDEALPQRHTRDDEATESE